MNQPNPINDERISAYLDHEMDEKERAEFEELLADREDYRQAVEELRSVSLAVSGLPKETAPQDFASQVMERLEQESTSAASDGSRDHRSTSKQAAPPQTSLLRRYFWPLAALAAALLMAIAIPTLTTTQNLALKQSSVADEMTVGQEAEASVIAELRKKDERDSRFADDDAVESMPFAESVSPSADASAGAGFGATHNKREMADDQVAPSVDSLADSGDVDSDAAAAIMSRTAAPVAAVPAEPLGGEATTESGLLADATAYDAVAEVALDDPVVAEKFFDTLTANQIELAPKTKQIWQANQLLAIRQQARAKGNIVADEEGQAAKAKSYDDSQAIVVQIPQEELPNLLDQLSQQAISVRFLAANQEKIPPSTTQPSASGQAGQFAQADRADAEEEADESEFGFATTADANAPGAIRDDSKQANPQRMAENQLFAKKQGQAMQQNITNKELIQAQQQIMLQNRKWMSSKVAKALDGRVDGDLKMLFCCPSQKVTEDADVPADLNAETSADSAGSERSE